MSYFIDMHISIYMSILRRNEFLVSFDISQSWADLQNDLLKLILSGKELHTNRKIPVKGHLRNSVAFSDCPTKKMPDKLSGVSWQGGPSQQKA